MSFWNDVKNEWRKPFKGTKKEKEDFWLNTAGCICGLSIWNVFLKTSGMPVYKDFFGAVACVILCDIAVAMIYILMKKLFYKEI